MKKAFTLIELIVVIAIIGILVLLGSGAYKGYTKDAKRAEHMNNIKVLEGASEQYYMKHGEWPRVGDEHFTSEELVAYAERILDITGEAPELDPEGKYYAIDYTQLSKYSQTPNNKENYILQNPVGSVMYLENLTEEGEMHLGSNKTSGIRQPELGEIAIYTVEDLNNIRNNLTGKYIIMADIDLSSIPNWDPIRVFTGTLYGNGLKIINLTINRPTMDNVGMIGEVGVGGKITNVIVENVNVTGRTHTGGLVGQNKGTVSNSYSTGTVKGTGERVGGLVGYSAYALVDSSYSTANVTGGNYTGGLVGCISAGTVSNSYATGSVKGAAGVGGVIGWNTGALTNSYATGSVTGSVAGSLVGYLTAGTVNTSFYTGSVGIVGSYQQGGSTTKSLKLTDTQMKSQASFTGWDFTNIWKIAEGQSYPTLKWQK